LTRQFECPNNSANAKCGIDVSEPVQVFLFGACGETGTKFGDKFATIFGPLNYRIVSCSNDTSQIA